MSKFSLKNHARISVDFSGGIGVLPLINDLETGAHNDGAKIIEQHWEKNKYTIHVEGMPGRNYEFRILSLSPLQRIENGTLKRLSEKIYTIRTTIPVSKTKYGTQEVTIHL